MEDKVELFSQDRTEIQYSGKIQLKNGKIAKAAYKLFIKQISDKHCKQLLDVLV